MKSLFAILNNHDDYAEMSKELNYWCLIMTILAVVAFVCNFLSEAFFSKIGESITLNVRSDLYT